MSFILEIQEIVWGPIKDLYLEISAGLPIIAPPPAPSFGDVTLNLGSSFGDANLGSSFGDQNLGSSDFGSSFGSSNGDQNLGSSGLQLPPLGS
ncbi:hypothetical protein [Corynebacterium kalidii]|uniref:Uncharacterized protein n=1 Tax=Corynebacterium kalidii TaxID=2931982 RepID=A0A9X1WI45_9CORY|nr:hypothetical protein [Corynebacterium kalidii]MCJ7859100.1 hypothetical protein [Corynebacterium kalidii]